MAELIVAAMGLLWVGAMEAARRWLGLEHPWLFITAIVLLCVGLIVAIWLTFPWLRSL